MLKWCKMKMAFPSANRKKTVEAPLSYRSNYVQVFDWAKQTYLFTLKIQQECDEPAANRNRASSLQILMWAEQICVDFHTFFFLIWLLFGFCIILICRLCDQIDLAEPNRFWDLLDKQKQATGAVKNCVTFEYNVTHLSWRKIYANRMQASRVSLTDSDVSERYQPEWLACS